MDEQFSKWRAVSVKQRNKQIMKQCRCTLGYEDVTRLSVFKGMGRNDIPVKGEKNIDHTITWLCPYTNNL